MEKIQLWLKNNKSLLVFSLLSAVVWGLVSHAYRFFGNDFSHDCLIELEGTFYGNSHKLQLGRIFSVIYRSIVRGNITLPWVVGYLSMLWIGLSVFLIMRIFMTDSKIIAFLTAGVLTSNASVSTTVATYLNDLDCNMFALFCTIIAVYIWNQVYPPPI